VGVSNETAVITAVLTNYAFFCDVSYGRPMLLDADAPRLYKQAHPGSDYAHSLKPLKDFNAEHVSVPTRWRMRWGFRLIAKH
jgi:lipoate synthase